MANIADTHFLLPASRKEMKMYENESWIPLINNAQKCVCKTFNQTYFRLSVLFCTTSKLFFISATISRALCA